MASTVEYDNKEDFHGSDTYKIWDYKITLDPKFMPKGVAAWPAGPAAGDIVCLDFPKGTSVLKPKAGGGFEGFAKGANDPAEYTVSVDKTTGVVLICFTLQAGDINGRELKVRFVARGKETKGANVSLHFGVKDRATEEIPNPGQPGLMPLASVSPFPSDDPVDFLARYEGLKMYHTLSRYSGSLTPAIAEAPISELGIPGSVLG